MKSRSFVLSLVTMLTLAALVSGCSSENKPNGPECITSLDCEDGYTCEDEKCVALPDIPPADKDTAAADDMTDELFDDEEIPVDETVTDDAPETGDDGAEQPDDAMETGDDAVETADDAAIETGDDMVETGDDAVIVDEDTVDMDTVDEDMVDEDLVDIQPDLDIDLYVDTTPPTVTATSPEDAATGVGVGTTIEVTFSEPMNDATLTTLTVTVEDDSPATVNGAVTYTAGTYTAVFTPAASLTYDTTYTVTVTTGVEDVAGNPLAAAYEFSFTTAIEEINECVTMTNPCDDVGDSTATCADTLGGYDCTCSGGFTPSGGTCQDVDECTLNTDGCAQNCQNTTGSHTCSCIGGYTLNGDGHACDNINECVTLDNPCNDGPDSGGSCADTDGGYTCTCSGGYYFSGGMCRDVDECLVNSNPCDDNGDDGALCANVSGSYSCTCVTPGYEFKTGSCRDIDECTVNNNPCNDNGDTGAGCTNTAGDYTCNCSGGWFDNGTTCDDTNECLGNPCDNTGDAGATCQDQVGDYTCNCSSGWDFSDGVSCKETNECVTLNNPCNDHGDTTATCTNTTGSYTCGCTIWYDFTDGGCKDIDECTLGTDTCDDPSRATCANTTGGYTCTCNLHYSGNGYTCTADTQTYTCSGAPANTLYYNGTSSYGYTQTWTGSAWSPADSAATYNATPAVNTCQYKCASNYTWNGSNACVADTRTYNCSGAPANTVYYNATSSYGYTQTWTGSAWSPADSTATYSAAPAVNTCQYTCASNYTWSGSACVADTKVFYCAAKPGNSTWNTVSDYEQTWTGSAWFPADSTTTYSTSPSTTACRFKCLANYEWTGSACINSRTQACSGIISNAVYYNDTTSYTITQTYSDGGGWQPPTAAYYGDGTPDVNTCEFKCGNNYNWNGSSCVAATRTYTCSGAPGNTVYYNGTASYGYTQTWNGSAWTPADSTATYNASPAVNTCQYKCAANYAWNGSSACINSRSQACSGIISNAIYYNGSNSYTITQSYTDGTGWQPPTTAYYDATPDTNTCGYKCAANYEWNGSACVNSRSQACTGIIANAVYANNLTSYTITQSYTDGGGWQPPTSAYYDATPDTGTCGFKCNTNYTWNGAGVCVADTRTYNCSGAPTNTVYYNGTSSYGYTQTWSGSAWTPADSAASYNAAPAVNTCQYKCAANYAWNGSSACINSRTQACSGLGTGALYYNNTTSYSITQSYTDGGGWQPAATAYYSDGTPDVNTCEFKCNTNYTWNGSICAANTQTGTCTGLPANAEWNTVSTITQTWNGSAWAPTTAATYNATPSTSECRFKCSAGNSWNGSACVAPFCGDGIPGNSTIPAFTETFESGFPAYAQNGNGTSDWATSTTQKHGGTYSLRSGSLYWADDYSSVYMNKYSDGQICFWHRSDSIWYGEFEVFVDGSSKYSRSSSLTTWTQTCITVTAGYRVIEFRFTISDDMGSGYWYVDDITFHNAMTEQCDTGSTTCTGLGFQCGGAVNCGSDCTWQAGEADCHNQDSCGDC